MDFRSIQSAHKDISNISTNVACLITQTICQKKIKLNTTRKSIFFLSIRFVNITMEMKYKLVNIECTCMLIRYSFELIDLFGLSFFYIFLSSTLSIIFYKRIIDRNKNIISEQIRFVGIIFNLNCWLSYFFFYNAKNLFIGLFHGFLLVH